MSDSGPTDREIELLADAISRFWERHERRSKATAGRRRAPARRRTTKKKTTAAKPARKKAPEQTPSFWEDF